MYKPSGLYKRYAGRPEGASPPGFRQLVLDTYKEFERGGKHRFALGRVELDQFVRHLAGLTAPEAPLLRLDPGRLLDKYVGESEKNLRRAFELAETVAPCVLWIDEIEKAIVTSLAGRPDGVRLSPSRLG